MLVGPGRCQFIHQIEQKLTIYTCIIKTLRQTALITEYKPKTARTKPCKISDSIGQDNVKVNKVKAIRRTVENIYF